MTVVMAMQIVFLLIGQYTVLNHIQPGIGNWVEITGKSYSVFTQRRIQNEVTRSKYVHILEINVIVSHFASWVVYKLFQTYMVRQTTDRVLFNIIFESAYATIVEV